jgi:hypothetical protein
MTPHLLKTAVTCTALLLLAAAAEAQQPIQQTGDRWSLIQTSTVAEATRPVAPLDGELERFRIEIDERVFAPGAARRGDVVALETPVGPRDYVITRVEQYLPGTTSIGAVSMDGSGDLVALTHSETGVVGVVTADPYLFHIVPDGGATVMARMDPHALDVLECGVEGHGHPPGFPSGEAARGLSAVTGHVAHMPSLAGSLLDPITIDLMIVYTDRAQAWANNALGSIGASIAQAMALSQTALDNSDVFITLRLVHVHKTAYNETIAPMTDVTVAGSHLRRFTANSTHPPTFNPWGEEADGHMEEVHALRDQYGADLMALFADEPETGGIAWLLDSVGGSPPTGFSVNRVQQMHNSYTLLHEIGHNMGNHHARLQDAAPAGPSGGIFEYSTGWFWTGSDETVYNSVMAYSQHGSLRSPYFSNPDILVNGVPTGSYFGAGASADNARSMRETKRTIASYRPTRVDPPVAIVDTSPINIEVVHGQTVTKTLTLGNTGVSDLMWQLDFSRPGAGARPLAPTDGAEAVEAPSVEPPPSSTGNISPSSPQQEGDLLIIYRTEFSPADGFEGGTHDLAGGMKAWSASSAQTPFAISTANPSQGTQHLRLPASTPLNATANYYSTYFGPWPTGSYEFSADISISATGGSTYFVILQDSQGGHIVAGAAYGSGGTIFPFNPGTGNFTTPGRAWTPGTYQRLTISFDPYDQRVTYEVNHQLVDTRPLVGTAPGRVWIQRSNTTGTDFMDLDNIVYQSEYRGFEWLEADRLSGVTSSVDQASVDLIFSAEDVEPGTYTAEVVIHTSDPQRRVITVPVQLTVAEVGTDDGAGVAGLSRLVGNHPNPFTSTTRIDYEIARAAHVTLEVFSVTGQRVMVLTDEFHAAGAHERTFTAGDLASGVYLYRLVTDDTVDVGRMLIVR